MLQGAEEVVDRFVRAIADDPVVDEDLVTAFVAVAWAFSKRHGIAYDTWIEVGVPRGVLCRARIRRGSAATSCMPAGSRCASRAHLCGRGAS